MKTDTEHHEFSQLWADADAIWTDRDADPAFAGYVSADYPAIYRTLLKLKSRSHTFLEWGSGLGVVAIMACRLGYESYGIEVESELVDAACELAEQHGASPTFAVGSFIPDEFRANPRRGDTLQNTRVEEYAAYDQIDMQLRDFDLVYAYPWPGEHQLFRSIIRRHASPNTLFLRYDAREGLKLTRPAKNRSSKSPQ